MPPHVRAGAVDRRAPSAIITSASSRLTPRIIVLIALCVAASSALARCIRNR
nr:hypothetical protein [Actinomadura sp. J1-007]